MFRRFLLHKAIGDKGLLLILPKPPICPRLLLGTFVGNVKEGFFRGFPDPAYSALNDDRRTPSAFRFCAACSAWRMAARVWRVTSSMFFIAWLIWIIPVAC